MGESKRASILDWVGAECRSALFAYWATFSFAYERI